MDFINSLYQRYFNALCEVLYVNFYGVRGGYESRSRFNHEHEEPPPRFHWEPPYSELREAYRVLGVPFRASISEVKKAWREKMKACHPDLHMGASESVRAENDRLSQLYTAAYNLISDSNSHRN